MATKLVGPGIWTLAIKVSSAALSYLMLVAFARMLDSNEYGYFGVALNIAIVLSTIVAAGLPVAILRFWPGHLARKEVDLAIGFHVGAQRILIATACAVMALGALAYWNGWWQNLLGSAPAAALVAVLAACFSIGDYYSSALRAQHKVFWSSLPRDIIWRTLSPALAGTLLYTNGALSAAEAVACCIAVLVLINSAQAIYSRRSMRHETNGARPAFAWSQWRGPLLPLAGASILYAMVQQLDVVLIGSLLGAGQAGSYFAAQKTASLLGLVMIAGGLVAAPLMSAAYQEKRRNDLQHLCRVMALAIALATAIGFVVLVLFGESMLAVFDPSYRAAYPLLLVLGIGYALDALAGPTAYLMQMTSLEGNYLRIMTGVYCLVLSLQLMFVPKYGAIAAAAATAFGVALWNIIAVFQLRRAIGVDSSILSFFLPPKPNEPRI